MVASEKIGLASGLKWCPVATNDAIMGDNGLEDASLVVRAVAMLWLKDDVTALVGNEVFVIRRDQHILAFAESPRAAIVSKIKFPAFPSHQMNGVAQQLNPPAAVADVQS